MMFKNILASKGKKKWYAVTGVIVVLAAVIIGLQYAHATPSSSAHSSNKQMSKSVPDKVTKGKDQKDQKQSKSNQSVVENTEQEKDTNVSATSSSTDQASQQKDEAIHQTTAKQNTSAPVSQPSQDINKGNPRQTVMPNVNVYGGPGLCLQYVDDAFNISSNRSYSATAAAGKASRNGTMHYNAQYPAGIKVPVYWNLISKDDGVNYGHIAIWDGQGGFYWEGNNSSTPNYFTLDEMNQIMNGTRQVNGHYLTENWQTPSLIGWSTSLEGHTIAENL